MQHLRDQRFKKRQVTKTSGLNRNKHPSPWAGGFRVESKVCRPGEPARGAGRDCGMLGEPHGPL